MRSLFSFGASKEKSLSERVGTRPEALRRRTLEITSQVLLAVSLLGMPVALFTALSGALLPFIIATIGMAGGVLTLALCRHGRFETAIAGQIYTVLLAGLVLTLADPALADFGLAIALLAPVHASLLAQGPLKKQSWMLIVGVVAAAAASNSGLIAWPETFHGEYALLAGAVFIVVAGVVAFASNRLNSAFDVYERAQINAYRHLIEHVQDAVIRFSAEGNVLFASTSSETLFACRRFELAGGGLGDRLHVLDRPLYLTAFADANMGGKARTIEVRMRRDDVDGDTRVPRYFWVEIAMSPVIDQAAPSARHEVVGLFRDISDRKANQVAMEEARKAAEEASSTKSRFLALIGHELRTPLNAIVGFSEMMTTGIGGELSAQHAEYARLIHGSGRHLLDVVKMLLDMSRIEAGKFEVQTEPFSPETLIEPCFKIVENLARDRGISLRADIRPGLPMLTADERACRQILINLLSNAVKFSRDNGTVTVKMWRQGLQLGLSVRDTGIGMSQADLVRIGEPFFQAQDGLARKYEGTGLGLSIVKGLIELHEGQLRATSQPGEGTTMTVLLPLNGPATKADDTAQVTPLRRGAESKAQSSWPERRTRAS